jgi:hypothetical protein
MTVYEALDLLIAELDQLRADNRRLKFELALATSSAPTTAGSTSNSPPHAASVTAVQVPVRL